MNARHNGSVDGGAVAVVLLTWAALFFGFWGTVIYIAYHFLSKFW